jgi:3-deoxy-manno-octulosonate cytidylyltransferase (CMP-KDO synthetase)
MKVLGLIPARLSSTRLPQKPLLEIDGLPLIIHTFKRSSFAKKLYDLAVCTDSNDIKEIVEKYGGKCFLTSENHLNGTERIAEVASKFDYDLIIDIQGDEPFIDFDHIDRVVDFHINNLNFDIVVPHLNIVAPESPNIVKLIVDDKFKVRLMSRAVVPYPFIKKPEFYKKHLSIVSFTRESLQKFSKLKPSNLEKIESIELLRAIENNLEVGSFRLDGDSFSVDVKEDLFKALKLMPKDRLRKLY